MGTENGKERWIEPEDRNDDGTFKKGWKGGPGRPRMGPHEKKLRRFLPEEWAKQLNDLLMLPRGKLRAIIAYTTDSGVECATDEPILRVRLAELLDSGEMRDVLRVLERYMPQMDDEEGKKPAGGQFDPLILASLKEHIPGERVEA